MIYIIAWVNKGYVHTPSEQ